MVIASALIVVAKYGRREMAPLATGVIFAASSAVLYAAPDLTVGSEAELPIGLRLTILLSITLLIHQALIMIRGKIRYSQRLHLVYQVLSVVTGSGYYRWNDVRR